jgi:hypothetical protein
MTEAEWLAGCDPNELETYLWQSLPAGEDRVSFRKLGLVGLACCRRIWPLLDARARVAVDRFEQYLDGGPHPRDLAPDDSGTDEEGEFIIDQYMRNPGHQTAACLLAEDAVLSLLEELEFDRGSSVYRNAQRAVAYRGMPSDQPHGLLDVGGAGCGVTSDIPAPPPALDEQQAQADLFREVFGNPFRPVARDTTWLTPVVISLAQAAYDQRLLPSGHLAPARLAVLADALEEAGCFDQAILDHLREPGAHVRGCWPVDLILTNK